MALFRRNLHRAFTHIYGKKVYFYHLNVLIRSWLPRVPPRDYFLDLS